MDPKITEIQDRLNAHCSAWGKITNLGDNWYHKSRVRKNLINKAEGIAPVYFSIKDHKKICEGELPKVRPICSSQQGMGVYLQDLISDLLEPVADLLEGGNKAQR